MATNNTNQKVIVRFPPSPTGTLHIGNVRTALFNYFFARKNDGQFIVRIEDTDKARSKKEYELGMLEDLTWLGLSYSGELWHQSERTEVYKKYLHKLIDEGKVYISQETDGENKEVARFKNPNKIVTFEDLVRGTISFDTTELKDFIIARNINEPVYHLAVVVDDFESGVTHIMRGEDHISNTPRHILLQEAIGAPQPIYMHLPLILAPDRSKLSKRKHGEQVSLGYYRNKGYLPEAMVNYLSLVGWNPGTDQEIFTLPELISTFDISQIQKGGAIFDEKKLEWINKEHMKRMSITERNKNISERLEKIGINLDDISSKLENPSLTEKLYPLIFDHISKWSDIDEMGRAGELAYYFDSPLYEKDMLVWKDSNPDEAKKHLEKVLEILKNASEENFENPEKTKSLVFDYATENGRGQVLWPLRVALSGKEKSPDPFTLIYILGKDESIVRLKTAIQKL
ncbi:MAG: hypothetical protein A3G47_00590 [Candidatus Zambryskibacteria bacterium RIFCSPLOWO2_12_FULL_39_45]|uniref:Glutamate--tRNA ligase n=3 Tax=Candidatus Zambryskiibacteriota TaxID=1817925 RepID=A0A1G2T6M8_9BACT|nr:MAG: Glutamate-tRNA ligase 1 [Parcubacteria group bacterium GW2011_GWA2_40_14]OHA92910.1 MAG: hypothetical protein A2W58_00130 [Candidatus Zambryskibacteria bacterium RIFCSPHIGHO2_02_38_10.5]OHA96206.1 MAG: hypothetical protein A3C63_02645 [Candidatus Zambryskibacteria bacterium RIFCSPHIGHO2_02_FULL_39_82]OHA98415.1 MAG: hypothetical protein A3E32_01865 [Candidatus Zambryskibacteria bacterium RIFCSPHIGHO2_12_FULL_38_37]OHB09183.1 MAG: hypothetical protein A2W64_01430 [Candidatus Zambryskibac